MKIGLYKGSGVPFVPFSSFAKSASFETNQLLFARGVNISQSRFPSSSGAGFVCFTNRKTVGSRDSRGKANPGSDEHSHPGQAAYYCGAGFKAQGSSSKSGGFNKADVSPGKWSDHPIAASLGRCAKAFPWNTPNTFEPSTGDFFAVPNCRSLRVARNVTPRKRLRCIIRFTARRGLMRACPICKRSVTDAICLSTQKNGNACQITFSPSSHQFMSRLGSSCRSNQSTIIQSRGFMVQLCRAALS